VKDRSKLREEQALRRGLEMVLAATVRDAARTATELEQLKEAIADLYRKAGK